MIRTLNQVVKGLNDIATAHQQINSFGFGDIWEMATSGVTNYPIMWVDCTGATRERSTTTYNLSIYLMDLVQRGEGNETEVLSDMHRIAEDVIAEIRHPDWTWVLNFDSVTIDNFTESEPDMLSGVKFDISLSVVQPDDRCQIPLNSITRN
jgi:hypothetical protein